MRIGDGGSVLVAEFLSQFDGAGGAGLDAKTASDTICRRHFGGIGGFGKVWSVEKHARAKGVADLHVAVADVEDVVRSIDVRDLVDETVVLGFLENG